MLTVKELLDILAEKFGFESVVDLVLASYAVCYLSKQPDAETLDQLLCRCFCSEEVRRGLEILASKVNDQKRQIMTADLFIP